MKSKIFIVLAACMLMLSCKNEPKDKEETRMDRVMAVHDELMPKMSTIGKLTTALDAKIDTTAAGEQYKIAKDSLVAAHDYMMDWMKAFGSKFDTDEVLEGKALSAEKEALLIEEEKNVQTMKDMMLGSIANAEALLAKEK